MRETEFSPQWLASTSTRRSCCWRSAPQCSPRSPPASCLRFAAAIATPRPDLRDGARSVAGGSFARVSRVLVVGEIALSCALLICVGTLVRGIGALDRAISASSRTIC